MTVTSQQGPLDRALSLSIAGDHEAALAIAVELLRAAPVNAQALFLAAHALSDLGRREQSNAAFELAIRRAIRAGNLPLALAGCCELRQAGAGAEPFLKELADTFGKGSKQLDERRAPPDMLPPPSSSSDYGERGQALFDKLEAVLAQSRTSLEEVQQEPTKVPPQVPFSLLEPGALLALVGAFEELMVDAGHVLIEEGTPGNRAFILARGELQVQRRAHAADAEPINLARLGAGALFGEMSLLSRSPRAASVVACRPSVVLAISKQALDQVAAAEPQIGQVLAQFTRQRMIDNLVRTSSILSAVKSTKRPALLERFVTRTFEAGDKVITQGQESSGLYLLASGLLSVMHRSTDDNLAISKLGPGEVVGEVALVLRRPSNADVIAEHPSVTLHLPRDEFLDLIKAHPEVLSELYELAVKRDEETRSLVAQEATDADEFILL